MKKLKNINTILVVLIIINYFAFSTFMHKDPGVLQEGVEFGKVSTNESGPLIYRITDFDTFGQGYAMVSIDVFGQNLTYYDYDHNLIWSKSLGVIDIDNIKVIGSDQYLALINANAENQVYNLEGELVSEFSINSTTANGHNYYFNNLLSVLISGETIFLIDSYDQEPIINATQSRRVILHSYDILTGELNWKHNLLGVNFSIWDDISPYFAVNRFEMIDESNQALTLVKYYDTLTVHQFSLSYNDQGQLGEIAMTENNFECLGDCSNDIIFSPDEVIGVDYLSEGEDRITLLKSSKGSELEIIIPRHNHSLDVYENSKIGIYNEIRISETEMILIGTIWYPWVDFQPYMGYLISDTELEFRMFDLNYTQILKMIQISDNNFISLQVRSKGPFVVHDVVIWSFSKLKTLDYITPFYINFAPATLLVLLVANITYQYFNSRKNK